MEITCVEKNVTKAIILRSRWRDGGREITTKISLPLFAEIVYLDVEQWLGECLLILRMLVRNQLGSSFAIDKL